jgi:hypothetical protein
MGNLLMKFSQFIKESSDSLLFRGLLSLNPRLEKVFKEAAIQLRWNGTDYKALMDLHHSTSCDAASDKTRAMLVHSKNVEYTIVGIMDKDYFKNKNYDFNEAMPLCADLLVKIKDNYFWIDPVKREYKESDTDKIFTLTLELIKKRDVAPIPSGAFRSKFYTSILFE